MSIVDSKFKQPRLQSSQSHFSKIPQADIPRSVFNRSHQYKTTFDAGLLIPIFFDEVLPGDSFKLRTTTFGRVLSPLKTPIMDNIYADIHYFFVPNRLIWENWEKFNGAQDNPGDSVDYLIPQFTAFTPTVSTLSDYLSWPTGKNYTANSLHHRAYNLIWNEWYRDQNLQNSVVVDKDDGPDSIADYVLLRRGKRHDYFTSSLPFPQKGPAVSIPIIGDAPVLGIGKINTSYGGTNVNVYESDGTTSIYPNAEFIGYSSGVNNQFAVDRKTVLGVNYPDIRADLSNASSTTINALREAFQLQRMFERDARGGTRYIEILKSHFGVTSPDFRLQRPEYLGGGSTMINTSPVPQTSQTDGTSAQGNLAAIGSFSHHGTGFSKSFVEHGVILGLISARADMTYQQGLNKMFTRQTRFEFYWPTLAHLGEQPVLNKEIYLQATSADDEVFGYQERYAEYRYKPSVITGKMNSTDATPLDSWHLAQEFSALPSLNSTFIVENPPMDRVLAVPSEPDFILDVVHDLRCARPMPVYSVPGLIDHF